MTGRGKVPARKRGRPATGRGLTVGVRCQGDFLAAVDTWRGQQEAPTSRAAAIRRLPELGWGANAETQSMPRRSPQAALKASDMAAQQIDKLVDPSATDEERH